METGSYTRSEDTRWCTCGCCCNGEIATASWPRSVKRKFGSLSADSWITLDPASPPVARVGLENECIALRETLRNREQCVQELYAELDEERNASASAANEAMSMILRLQREKAEIQMEARQFKRYVEEKMAHDQEELLALEDLLYKREQVIHALNCDIQAYKHRLLSLGCEAAEPESAGGGARNGVADAKGTVDIEYDDPFYGYPPLKCNLNETPFSSDWNDVPFDVEKYAFGEMPRTREKQQNLECRNYQLERNVSNNENETDFSSTKDFLEKVVVGKSPRRGRHLRRFSQDSTGSFCGLVKEAGKDPTVDTPRHRSGLSSMKTDDYTYPGRADNASDSGENMSDRIYTIDSVQGVPYNRSEFYDSTKPNIRMIDDDFVTTPKGCSGRIDTDEVEIKKLYLRLQALEADRESMRQAIISMRTEKAQLILLKEIAQQLCKEIVPEQRVPMSKSSSLGSFWLVSIVKWVMSCVLWRKKARGSKYTFGLSKRNVGLLLLLDKPPHKKLWRILSKSFKA